MAQLTDRLSLTDGTNRVFDPPAMPSALGTALEFAGATFDGFMNLRRDMAENKRKEREKKNKEEEARIAYEVAGAPQRAMELTTQTNAGIIAAKAEIHQQNQDIMSAGDNTNFSDVQMDNSGVFTVTPASVTPAAEKEISNATGRAMSVVAAVEQSKLPPITLEASLNADFRRLREKYPDHVEYILDMYKKAGIDSNLFTELQDAKDEREYAREANQAKQTNDQKFRQETIEVAKIAYGTDSLNMSEDELFIQGLSTRKAAYDLDISVKEANAATARASASKANREEIQGDLNQNIERIIGNMVFNDSQPYIRMGNELMDSLIRDPNNADSLLRWQQMGPKVNQLVELSVNKSVELAIAKGYTGDTEKLRGSLRARFEPIKQMFQGDYSLANTSMTALKAVQATLKLNVSEALPFFSALQAAGMKPEAMPGLLKAIDGNKELQEQLNKEAKGFVDDWGEDRGSTRILNAIKILRGETTFQYMSPNEAAKTIPVVVGTVLQHAKDYTSGRLKDPDSVINGVGEIAVNLRTLGPSTPSSLLYIATKGFADATVRRALIKSVTDPAAEDKTDVLATIQASRAGSAHILNNVRLRADAYNKTSNYFKIVYQDGEYKVDKSGLYAAFKHAKENPTTLGAHDIPLHTGEAARLQAIIRGELPSEVKNLIQAGNISLNNAIELGRVDPTTPKATDLELRDWYATNKPLPVKGNKPINLEKQIDTMFEGFDQAITTGIQSATSGPVNLPVSNLTGLKKIIVSGEAGPAGYNSVYGDTAKGNSFGFVPPKPVSSMTVEEAIKWGEDVLIPATKGKVGAGDKGTSALGAYQITSSTLKEFGEKVFGAGWKNVVLTPENQDKLAEAIIASTGGDREALIGRWPSLKGKL